MNLRTPAVKSDLWASCPLTLLIAAVLLIGTSARAGNPDAPDLSRFTSTCSIPFANQVDFNSLKGMRIRVSLNGGPVMTFLVDTGSVGIVVSEKDVPNIDPNAPVGSMIYSSSGVELDGVWTPVTVTFPDTKDAKGQMASAVVPVLAVHERKVSGVGVNAAGIKPSANPKVYMFGVGFGRGKEPHPERNPFINLKEMQAGTMNRGYTITRDGFTLGLTGSNTGYLYQKLKERPLGPEIAAKDPGVKDWETTPGSFSVGSYKSAQAGVLIDTGLTNMILCDPAGPQDGDVPDGTDVTVNLLNGKLHYTFKAGDKSDPVAPRRITWDKLRVGVTINTGLHALSIYDYLFDASDGYLGLRPAATHR